MPTVSVTFADIPGTEAMLGRAGIHSIIADRPEGKAGGMGLGFNGAQLLALAIGGCFCNDLRYIAYRRGMRIASLLVKVTLDMEGNPLVATRTELSVECRMEDGSNAATLVEEAKRTSMVGISVAHGFPVEMRVVE